MPTVAAVRRGSVRSGAKENTRDRYVAGSWRGLALAFLLCGSLIVATADAIARGGSSQHSNGTHNKSVAAVPRDSHGRIQRSEKAKDQFKKLHPCPSTGKSSGSCP